MIKILLATICVSACVGIGSAIRCYECSSANNSMCLEPAEYDHETLQRFLRLAECSEGIFSAAPREFFCRKIVQTILHKGHDAEVRVSRGCGWVRARKPCYKADNEDHLETVCQCFEDGCNAAGVVTSSAALLLLAAFINKWL